MDRREPFRPFPRDVFEAFFGSDLSKCRIEPLAGGASNSNHLVTDWAGNRFVCRVHRRPTGDIERWVMENAPVPTPQVLWTDGCHSVLSFIEGVPFGPACFEDAGRMIARLATVQFSGGGWIQAGGTVESHVDWPDWRTGLLQLLHHTEVTEFLAPDVVESTQRLIEDNAAVYASFDGERRLVHGDFRPDNLLMRDGRIVAILDWEFSHSGTPFMDIGNLLRHFPESETGDLERGLIQGGFDLPPDWRRRAALCDLASHLEFLTSPRSDDFKRSCALRIERLACGA